MNRKLINISILSILLILFTAPDLTATDKHSEKDQPETTVYELISMTEQLSMIHEFIETAGMADLFHEQEITVFLPVNDAFDTLSGELLDSYRDDPEALQNLLNHHVIEGEILSREFEDGQSIEMRSGSTANIAISGAGIEIDEANVIQVDVDASNGVIHVVNRVLILE